MTGEIWALILAGGSGERLWPLSTPDTPKHLITVNGSSLLEQTVLRTVSCFPENRILIVTRKSQSALVRKTLRRFPKIRVISEPVPRNTLPAILAGVSWIELHSKSDPSIAVFPADHFIGPLGRFKTTVRKSLRFVARQDKILLWGIQPSSPSTQYGYIRSGTLISSGFSEVDQFREKPDLKTAKRYFKNSNYYFNAGIFFFRSSVIRDGFANVHPNAARYLERLFASNSSLSPRKQSYNALPKTSIDYGLLEKSTNRCAVVPVKLTWSDIGSLDEFINKFSDGTSHRFMDSPGSLAFSQSSKTVTLLGCPDTIVVEAGDHILVTSKSALPQIREINTFCPKP